MKNNNSYMLIVGMLVSALSFVHAAQPQLLRSPASLLSTAEVSPSASNAAMVQTIANPTYNSYGSIGGIVGSAVYNNQERILEEQRAEATIQALKAKKAELMASGRGELLIYPNNAFDNEIARQENLIAQSKLQRSNDLVNSTYMMTYGTASIKNSLTAAQLAQITSDAGNLRALYSQIYGTTSVPATGELNATNLELLKMLEASKSVKAPAKTQVTDAEIKAIRETINAPLADKQVAVPVAADSLNLTTPTFDNTTSNATNPADMGIDDSVVAQ